MSSCSQNTTRDDSKEQLKSSENTSQAESTIEEQKVDEFEMVKIKGGFEDFENYKVNFRIVLDIKNNTANKITFMETKGFLELNFKGEGLTFYPPGASNVRTEDDYLNGLIYGERLRESEAISANSSWKPNQIRSFTFNATHWNYLYQDGISAGLFQRTPKEAFFAIKYNAVSVDGEYTDIKKYDIMDSWKDYQKKLGLR